MKKVLRSMVAGVVLLSIMIMTCGCAHTTMFITRPEGANVYIDSKDIGKTPVEFKEKTGWSKSYVVEIKKRGYREILTQLHQYKYNKGELAAWIISGIFLHPLMLIGIGKAKQLDDKYIFKLERKY